MEQKTINELCKALKRQETKVSGLVEELNGERGRDATLK